LEGVEHEVFVTAPTHLPSWEGLVERQNVILDKFLSSNCDYLWLVELDVQVPRDSFQNLLDLDIDLACGYVKRHNENGLICGFLDENMRVWYLPLNAVKGNILSGWVMAGTSCILFKRRVFEDGLRFRYDPHVTPDILFMFDVQSRGFVAKVHGDVLCGHLPEWPLPKSRKLDASTTFNVLDVGCGHRGKGDVNVDLHPEATAHRSADQRVCDDVGLNVKKIPNFVRADGCHLPFRRASFGLVLSQHLIEHLENAEALVGEMTRVSGGRIEIRCPHGNHPQASGLTKPLHVHRFDPSWFRVKLPDFGLRNVNVQVEYSQGEPREIVATGEVSND
jgi:SAM-dependent methyltransferase